MTIQHPHFYSESESRLLFHTTENVEKLSRELVLELGEPDAETAEVKTILESLDQEKNEPAILEAFRNNLGGLNEQVHTQINANLGKLATETTLGALQSRLQQLKDVMVETKKVAAATAEKPPFLTQVGDTLAHATDAVLPKEWVKGMDRNQKIATAVVGTAGVIVAGVLAWKFLKWLGGWTKNAAQEGQEAAKNANGGWLKKILIGTGIGLAAFFGIKWYLDGSLKRALEGGVGAAKDIAGKAKEKGVEILDHHRPWLGYGLTEGKFKEAKSTFRAHRDKPAVARGDIQKIFDERLGENRNKKSCDEFMVDMARHYETEVRDGIIYAHPAAAIENYRGGIETIALSFKEYIRTHSGETGIAAIIAWKFHLAGVAFDATKMTTAQTADFAKTLAGIAGDHPLLTLLGAGGALAGLEAASLASTDAWMPESFPDLKKAIDKGEDIAADLVMTDEQKNTLYEIMSAINSLDTDKLGLENIEEELGSFLSNLPGKIADSLAVTPEERVAIVNGSALTSLENQLAIMETASSNSTAATSKAPDLDKAKGAFKAFKDSMLTHRIRAVSDSQEPIVALKDLQDSLLPLDITIVSEDSILYWQYAGKKQTLCIDPALTDSESINRISGEMTTKDSEFSNMTSNLQMTMRMMQQDAMERGEFFGIQNKPTAMVIGGLAYLIDPRNLTEIIVIPAQTLNGLTGHELGNLYARTLAFAISAETLSQITKLVMGGKVGLRMPWPKSFLDVLGKGSRILGAPIVEPGMRLVKTALWSKDAWNSYITLTKNGGFNFGESRHVLQLLQKTGLRIADIHALEAASGTELRALAKSLLGNASFTAEHSDDYVRSVIRAKFIKDIEGAKITSRLGGLRSAGTGWKTIVPSMSHELELADSYKMLTRASGLGDIPLEIIQKSAAGDHSAAAELAEKIAAKSRVVAPTSASTASSIEAPKVPNSIDDLARAQNEAMNDINNLLKEADVSESAKLQLGARVAEEIAEAGQDANKVAQISRNIKETGKVVSRMGPIAKGFNIGFIGLDIFSIYCSVSEMYATSEELKKDFSEEYKENLRERYPYLYAQASVSGVSAVASLTAFVAAGTTAGAIAFPVAVATAPIGIAIAGNRAMKESWDRMGMSVDDRIKSTSLDDLLQEVLNYGFFEKAQDVVNASAVVLTGTNPDVYINELNEDQRRNLRAIAQLTSSVTFPTRILENGVERELTQEESTFVGQQFGAFIEAKTAYLAQVLHSDRTIDPKDRKGIGHILREADARGRIARDNWLLTHHPDLARAEGINESNFIKNSRDVRGHTGPVAEQYEGTLRNRAIFGMLQSAIKAEETGRPKEEIQRYLQENLKNIMLQSTFSEKIESEHELQQSWSVSGAMKGTVREYRQAQVSHTAERYGEYLAQELMGILARGTATSQEIDNFMESLQGKIGEIRFQFTKDPDRTWNGMSETERTDYRYLSIAKQELALMAANGKQGTEQFKAQEKYIHSLEESIETKRK